MAAERGRAAVTEEWSRERVEKVLARFGRDEAEALATAWAEAQKGRRGRPAGAMKTLPAAFRDVFVQEGLPPIRRLLELYRRWPELAGPQWASCAEPLVIRNGELLVESSDRRIVRRLGHDAKRLAARLNRHFGPGFVDRVRVIGPP